MDKHCFWIDSFRAPTEFVVALKDEAAEKRAKETAAAIAARRKEM
jgi:hypothetical protein